MAIIPDWTLLLQLVNFIALIIILNAVCYKPIRSILTERKKKIQGYEQDIDALQQEADESDQTFQTKMGEAKAKGFQEQEALKESGHEEEKRLIDEINQKAQADLAAVRTQVAKEAEDARRSLKADVEVFSAAIAQRILGRAVS